METVGLYIASEASNNRVNIPRTTLSIFNAINMTFPDELSREKKETLLAISNLSPILIAANEAADIGVSARLRLKESANNLTERQGEGLKRLEKETFDWLARSISDFKDIYGLNSRESEVIDSFTHDFILLSQERKKIPLEDYREYVELDSLICILGCVAICAPDVLAGCGFDFGQGSKSVEELRKKYSPFIIRGQGSNRDDKLLTSRSDDAAILTMAEVMSLQGAEMVLKVKDDITGRKIDRILGIPNLYDYAKSKVDGDEPPTGVLEAMRKEYLFLAETGGLSKFTVHTAEVLCHLTSVRKAKIAGLKKLDSIGEDTSIVSSSTTTLRHELEAAGILDRLFSQ
ncbi:MAG: hypothetical protein ACC618_03850 [Patescibacteria group bacterium]